MKYWDNDAYGYFDGEATSQHTTVCVVDESGTLIANGLEKHEVRTALYRHFHAYGAHRDESVSRNIERLDYALTNHKTELQVTCENRLGIRISVRSRGEMYL